MEASQQLADAVARAVLEVMETLVSSELAEVVLERALSTEGLTSVPPCGAPLQAFVSGSLWSEMNSAAGEDAADLMSMQLASIVHHATQNLVAPSSSVSPFDAHSRPQILLATMDLQHVSALRGLLGPRFSVRHIRDLGSLLEALDELSERRATLVLDCRAPTVHPASVAALAADLPAGSAVIVWGADDEIWELTQQEPGRARWTRVAHAAEIPDLGALCQELSG